MYQQYFGLSEAPFSIAVNPRYLFMSARHRDALAHLLYGVGAGGGFILLTGEVGTGKTTLNRCLLEQLPHDTDVAIILNPALNAMELLATVCDELGVAYNTEQHTLKSLTDALHRFLLDNYEQGRKTVLMIDEAQHLDFDVLEQIRLLTNLETHSEKLLQIILIGQPELAQMLARPELRQLNQRITARYNLEPLNLAETGAYIQHRLQVAGMTPDRQIFPPAVVRGIYRHTHGVPRLINVLCDRILLGAYGRNKQRADRATLRDAAREVLGEDRRRHAARWPWALAALVLIGCGIAWWVLDLQQEPTATAMPEVVAPAPAPAEQPAAVATAPAAAASAAVTAEQPATLAGAEAPVPQVAVPDADPAGMAATPATPLAWLQPPQQAQAQLWALYSDLPVPAELCADPAGRIACVEGEAATWDELAALSQPLLLDMVTPERFAAATLLLGIEGRRAWVALDAGVSEVALADLAPLWTGGYRHLWQVPVGFERPLAQGDSGPAVAAVALLFAQLDQQSRPLTDTRFNAALKQRVILFQRANGLEDDGVVGVQTLLKLNAALGIDVNAEQARARFARAGEG
ncbi:AAA family ATPase [Pseudohalioglobus sediminis]|uniref:AAA family ATPase n=1 Tax=Pseudohalioglobus sediminis TaxID=2606449 RepID=A0A5B0X6S0_9GAMM|nr:AAA family ATPase [Pseudohalioglobus sediminis]KAA1194278.1 AAA family ATPase [Pseudohalioglobus sediminis]